MTKSKSDSNSLEHGTTVTCVVDKSGNDLLTIAAAKSGRSKKAEAEIRLRDHLSKFESIAEVGNATAF